MKVIFQKGILVNLSIEKWIGEKEVLFYGHRVWQFLVFLVCLSIFWIGIENLAYAMHDDPLFIEEIFDFWTDYLQNHSMSLDISLENFQYYLIFNKKALEID